MRRVFGVRGKKNWYLVLQGLPLFSLIYQEFSPRAWVGLLSVRIGDGGRRLRGKGRSKPSRVQQQSSASRKKSVLGHHLKALVLNEQWGENYGVDSTERREIQE